MDRWILGLALLLAVAGCVQAPVCGDRVCASAEKGTCPADCDPNPLIQTLEEGDSLYVTGAAPYADQALELHVDRIIDSYEKRGVNSVQLSLREGSRVLQTKTVNVQQRVHELFPIKDLLYVNWVTINPDGINNVKFEFQKYYPSG
ncbi:MAG: hypothetical protein HY917_01400 [Candidatus Diapherotrites archaeon]|nr:hypothetical protein [Candidatus Diapherotrites archaeon]